MTGGSLSIVDKIVAIHRSLDDATVAHAFGGALALAWCTKQARGTIDIDLNVFANVDAVDSVIDALPEGVACEARDRELLARDGQARLWWDTTPLDIFLDTTPFHRAAAARVRQETFGGELVPFLSCTDLAVFKAFFDRTRDWADIEEMLAVASLDAERVIGVLVEYLGPSDPRVVRSHELTRRSSTP